MDAGLGIRRKAMTVSTQGIIKGRQIQLDKKTSLPDGARVRVLIKMRSKKRERSEELARLFGSCADDPTFAAAVAKIERQRRLSPPREVDFDVAS
jgi:hypothetical protein